MFCFIVKPEVLYYVVRSVLRSYKWHQTVNNSRHLHQCHSYDNVF